MRYVHSVVAVFEVEAESAREAEALIERSGEVIDDLGGTACVTAHAFGSRQEEN